MREPAAARRRLTEAAAALLALAAATSCSGEAGDQVAPTVAPTIAVGSLPAPVETSPRPAPVVDVDAGGPTFVPAAIVPPAPSRPWLLVGTSRAAAGAPRRVAVFSSPDGTAWSPVELASDDHSSVAAAYPAPDGSVVLGGSVDAEDGAHPAVWRLTGAKLSSPDVIGAVRGAVTAMADVGGGAPALLLTTPDGPAVTTPSGGGGWITTVLPGGGQADGIAVSAAVTVVTGSTVWRSVDGGVTFEATPAAPVLGAVAGQPGGFVAASCATGGVALSPDGQAWTDLPASHPRGVAPVPSGGCGTIAMDDEGGVWLAAVGGEPSVFRILDGVVDRLGVVPRPSGTLFEGPPLVAAAGGQVLAAVPQPGGVATAAAPAVALTTELELDAAMVPTAGAPGGHARPVAVVPLDDRGRAVGIATYPVVVDGPDGAFRWSTSLRGVGIDGSGALVVDDGVAPAGPDGSLGGIVRLGRVEVSLATAVDAGVQPGATGPVGDVVMSRRDDPDGAWSAREVVAGGAGRQAVAAVVAVGAEVVAVGEQVVVDPDGAVAVSPLIVASDGTRSRSIAVDAPGVTLSAACPLPGDAVVAVGREVASGRSVLLTIDAASGTVSVPTPGPEGVGLTSCASDSDVVLLAADRALFTTSDGTTVVALEGLAPGEVVTGVAAGPGRVAVTGTTSTGDGFVFAGPAPDALARLAVPALGGPGVQEPTGVVVRADDLVVLGVADGAPAAWPLPLG